MATLDELFAMPAEEVRYEILVPLLERHLLSLNEEGKIAEEPVFRASGIGYCGRALLYKLRGEPDTKTPQEFFTLNVGTALHELIQGYIKQIVGLGISLEEEITCEELPMCPGHYDYVLKIGKKKYLLEIKTCNVEAYQNLCLRPYPYDAHKKQATIYMNALGIDETIFLYVNKNTRLLKEFEKENPGYNPIFLEIHYKYDSKLFNDRKEFVEGLIQHFKDNTSPDYKRIAQCVWCKFADKCKADRKQQKKEEKNV